MTPPPTVTARARRVAVVTGLSGAGKSSILRALEDLGYETVDNPPLSVLGTLLGEPGEAPLAVCVDARTRGFDAAVLRSGLAALRARGGIDLTLVFATADADTLLRRYSETRRRHPLAPGGEGSADVAEGIAREAALIDPLREAADWLLDSSALPLPDLRRMVEHRLRPDGAPGLAVSVTSFAYPRGLPRDADLVLDLRFLRNPHYDPALRPLTGRDAAVAAFIEADPDFPGFWERMTALLVPLLPRYEAEGKKYLAVALGCTGGKHRSVLAAERLTSHLRALGWRVDLTHRELPVQMRPTAAVPPAAPAHPGPEARAATS